VPPPPLQVTANCHSPTYASDQLARTVRAAKANRPTKVFLEGRLFVFDAPTDEVRGLEDQDSPEAGAPSDGDSVLNRLEVSANRSVQVPRAISSRAQ
jgi:hypothetical protein